jgi:hypothetical protein
MDADPGVHLQQERNRIEHPFHLEDCIAVLILLCKDPLFDPAVKGWNQYLPPVLQTKDNQVLVSGYHVSVAVEGVRCHAGILIANICLSIPPGAKPQANNLQPFISHR